jgi:hypothetical protein
VRNLHIARDLGHRALDEADAATEDVRFTPAAFFKDAGLVIAVCLALGVLAQLLLG